MNPINGQASKGIKNARDKKGIKNARDKQGIENARIKEYMRTERWNARNARAYDAYTHFFSVKGWEQFLDRAMAGVRPGADVLDFGTGTGVMASLLARAGFNVTGIDLSDQMLARARANLNAQGLGSRVDLIRNDGEALKFPDNRFDAVVSRWVIWTLPDPDAAIQEMVRVTRPNGMVMVIDGKSLPQGRLPALMSTLTDCLITRRPPWWRDRFCQKIDPLLPRFSLDQVRSAFSNCGLTGIRHQEQLERETESRIRRRLLGYNWSSYMIQGKKPAQDRDPVIRKEPANAQD